MNGKKNLNERHCIRYNSPVCHWTATNRSRVFDMLDFLFNRNEWLKEQHDCICQKYCGAHKSEYDFLLNCYTRSKLCETELNNRWAKSMEIVEQLKRLHNRKDYD